jgi:opacity protein-like surface antigen
MSYSLRPRSARTTGTLARLALVAAALVPGVAQAQDIEAAAAQVGASVGAKTRPIRFGVAGGVLVPRQGNSMRSISQGMQAQGFVLVRMPAGLPELRFNADFGRMRLERARTSGTPTTGTPTTGTPGGLPTVPADQQAAMAEVTRTLLAGVASLKLDLLRGPVRPYVLGGVGAFNVSDDVAAAALTDESARRQIDFGLDAGAGISLQLGPIDAFVETRLQNVYTKQKGLVDTRSIQAFPVTFGFTI